jgi:potassium channel subfamily K
VLFSASLLETSANLTMFSDGNLGARIKNIPDTYKDTAKAIIKLFFKNKKTLVIALSVFVYFAAVVIVFSREEGWDFMDCIYFAVVVVTTVGYGDFLPTTDGSKIAFVFLSQFALAIVAFAIGNLVDVVRSVFLAVVQAHDEGTGIFQHDERKKRRQIRSLLALSIYLALLLLGTIVFATGLEWDDSHGNKWVNGVYLTVTTMTTIGFGDFSPAEPHGMKAFGMILMLVGIPATVTTLALATELVFGSSRDALKLRVIKNNMTHDKFRGMNEFVKKIRAEGIGNYRGQGDDKISRFEFLCFVLVQNEVVEVRNIANVMKNFDEMDKTNTGFIEQADVDGYVHETPKSKDKMEI